MIIEPTLEDYTNRLRRLLNDLLNSAGSARAQLAADGAKRGEFSDTSSGFRQREHDLARSVVVSAAEVALSECRRISERTSLSAKELLERSEVELSAFLAALMPVVVPHAQAAFRRSGPALADQRREEIREELRAWIEVVFREYERGLYMCANEPGAPVIINMANFNQSVVWSLQQSGAGSKQQGPSS